MTDDVTLAHACMTPEQRIVHSAIALCMAANDESEVMIERLAGTATCAVLGQLLQDVGAFLAKDPTP